MIQIKGVDVYNGNNPIDWSKVKAAGYQFAFIKATEGSNYSHVDFFRNQAPKALGFGLHVGSYHFARFSTVPEAIVEARYFISVVKDFKLTYPLALDLEVNKQKASKKQLTDAAIAFMDYIINAGYQTMLYTYDSFLDDQLDATRLTKYPKWLAHYGGQLKNAADIWQYCETGRVDGIDGDVDLNIAYRDFAPEPVKSEQVLAGWKKENSMWFYYEGGKKGIGWLQDDGKWYYLKEGTGQMVVGWYKVAGTWYYFNFHGVMQTGWITDKGKKYYLDAKGKMVTGQQIIDGKTYTFDSSGALQ